MESQNNATAATLASDKYFTNRILEDAGVATLGGEYFFLHERRRSHRAPGHEREDAFEYLRRLGGTAFAKPLLGSRGDFAQMIRGEAPPSDAALTLARKAARALGLRVAAVDIFAGIGGEPDAMAVIEVNANPSIRLLEESGRSDLILKIWRDTFSAIGLL